MELAKIEIANINIFEKLKTSIDFMKYIECGVCRAIRLDAEELARVVHSFIAPVEEKEDDDIYDDFSDLCSDILANITVSAPYNEEDYIKYVDWKATNKRPVYNFLKSENETCGCYDELVVYHDLVCDCFGKDNIKDKIEI